MQTDKRRSPDITLLGEKRKPQMTLHLIVYIALIFTFGFILLISYWLLWPYTPMVIKEPIEIMNTNKTVEAGKVLVYKMDMDKRTALPCMITKQIVNGFIITSSPIIGNLRPGKYSKTFPLTVPNFADSGMNKLKWSGTYHVNPLRRITVVAWSEPFFIVTNKDNKDNETSTKISKTEGL